MLRVLFPPSRLITIGVEGEARSRVGFLQLGAQQWSGLSSDLYPALLIEDCPKQPPELGELPAGQLYAFLLSVGVRRDACVPLAVTRNGGRVHRRVVAFGGGECAGRAAAERAGEIAALVFGDPLVSPPRKRRNNKILWVSRRPADDPSDLRIRAQRMAGTRAVGRPVRRRVEGGPGPSIIDLPGAGCWRLGLSWSGRSDAMDLRYERRDAGSR